jgi:hypothetical protein
MYRYVRRTGCHALVFFFLWFLYSDPRLDWHAISMYLRRHELLALGDGHTPIRVGTFSNRFLNLIYRSAARSLLVSFLPSWPSQQICLPARTSYLSAGPKHTGHRVWFPWWLLIKNNFPLTTDTSDAYTTLIINTPQEKLLNECCTSYSVNFTVRLLFISRSKLIGLGILPILVWKVSPRSRKWKLSWNVWSNLYLQIPRIFHRQICWRRLILWGTLAWVCRFLLLCCYAASSRQLLLHMVRKCSLDAACVIKSAILILFKSHWQKTVITCIGHLFIVILKYLKKK